MMHMHLTVALQPSLGQAHFLAVYSASEIAAEASHDI